MELYQRSITIDKTSGNLKSEAVNLGNLGALFHHRGEYSAALESYQKALDIGRGIGSKEIQARNLGNIALLYQLRGEREKALESQLLKLSIEQMMGYKRGQAVTLGNIGAWYAESGEFELAVEHYEQALTIIRDLKLTSEEPRLLMNMGLARQYKGDIGEALTLLSSAVEKSVAVKNKVAEEYARRYLGFVYLEMNELENALMEFQLSGDVAGALGSKVGKAAVKVGLGLIQIIRGQDHVLFHEGHEEVRKLGDSETVIKGAILFAKWSLLNWQEIAQGNDILKDALEIARAGGRRRDIIAIEPLLRQFQSN
jgi:tetratricopeptide (TPR) repeat protein